MIVRMTKSSPNNAIRALLTGVVDYAGLFPPSKLPMKEAVKNYANYKNSQYSWMLGRFVVPVTRLDEFLKCSREIFVEENHQTWFLSALAGNDIYETMGQIVEFNAEYSPNVVIDSLEVKADSNSEIEYISDAVPRDLQTFCEVPLDGDIGELIATLAINKRFAKVRMGGVTEDAFPKIAQVMRFIRTCIAANLPFKATAGLHHPLRCLKALDL